MKCRCGHEEEKHYGGEHRHCNAIACFCNVFVVSAEKVNVPAPVVKVEEPVKRKPGRPKGI